MSRYLNVELSNIKDELTVRFLQEAQYQLTDGDHEAVRQALAMIKKVHKHKACHYACCALFTSGRYKCGTHIYARRMHEFSVCAETRPLERANWKERIGEPDPIATMATFHGAHDINGRVAGEPYLVSPCERCLRLLDQLSQECLIVTDIDGRGRLVKIPIDAVPFFRHPRCHNGE